MIALVTPFVAPGGAAPATTSGGEPGAFAAPHALLDGGGASVFVYNGNGALNEGFNSFAAATGKALVSADVLPADVGEHACVVLPINAVAFSAAQIATFAAYLAGGGNLFLIGEASPFGAAINAMNGLSVGLGSTMSITPLGLDGGFHDSENIGADDLTADVDVIHYAFTSQVNTPAPARLLVSSEGGTPIVGAEAIGAGTVVLSGDSNIWSDNSDGGYMDQDNGVLVGNVCGVSSFMTAHSVIVDIGAPTPPSTFVDRIDVYFPSLQATLTRGEGGAGISGQDVHFLAGGEHVCTAETDDDGLAVCGDPLATVAALAAGGFTAMFEGTPKIDGSEDDAGLAVVNGEGVP